MNGHDPNNGSNLADPSQALKTSTAPNTTQNLVLITEGLVIAEVAQVMGNENDCTFDNLHFWKAMAKTSTPIKQTKRTNEAGRGDERMEAASESVQVTERVNNILEGVRASRNSPNKFGIKWNHRS